MKDENLVLREKETDVVRLRKEIEALHLVIPLLAENRDFVEHGMAPPPPSLKAGLLASDQVPDRLTRQSLASKGH